MSPRRSLVALGLVAAVALSACADSRPDVGAFFDTGPAIVVAGSEISTEAFLDEAQTLATNPTFVSQGFGIDQIQASAAGFDREFINLVVRLRVFFTQVEQEMAEQGLTVTDADRDAVRAQLEPLGLSSFPEEYAAALIEDGARQIVLQNFFGDQFSFNTWIEEANRDVSVSSRLGTWDPVFGGLDPPAGPAPDPDASSGLDFGG